LATENKNGPALYKNVEYLWVTKLGGNVSQGWVNFSVVFSSFIISETEAQKGSADLPG
jgi:hypothetical protein